MQFDPDDEEAFARVKNELVDRFEATEAGSGLGWVAGGVLDFKFGYLDGEVDHWSTDDVTEILLDLYPRKAIVEDEDVPELVTGFAAFLRFLGHEDIVSPAQADRLARRVIGLEDEFQRALADDSNWSFGKRLWSSAMAEGVDLSDQGELQAFMDRFNQLPLPERDAILGPMGGPPIHQIDPFPPVVLPPIPALEEMAAEAQTVRRVTKLVEFIGEGRGLTQTGNLKLADAPALIDLLETDDRFDQKSGDRVYKTRSTEELPGVHLTYRLAVESDMLHRKKTKVISGPQAHLLTDDPLEALYGLFLTLLETIGPTRFRWSKDTYGFGWYAEDLDTELPMMLLELYRHGAHEIEELADRFWELEMSEYDFSHEPADKLDLHRTFVTNAVRRAMHHLVDLGVVSITGEVETPNRFHGVDVTGGWVELTPLGTWAVQRIASKIAPAPVAGELAGLSAPDLLVTLQDLPDDRVRAETAAWIERHPDAADLVVDALVDAGETARGIGFQMLIDIGPDAEPAVERLASHPELGAIATVWRVDTLVAAPEEMDCTGNPERYVRLLGTVVELRGPEAAVAAWAGPAAGADGLPSMLDQIWRIRLDATAEVLTAIAGHHPDPPVAKAARKALFKHRS